MNLNRLGLLRLASPSPSLDLSRPWLPSAELGPSPSGGGGTTGHHPFDIFITSTGSTRTVTIWPGTVNQLLVSNYLTGVTVSPTGTYYLVIDCTASDGQITSATLAIDSVPPPGIAPTAGSPPVSFKILVGVIVDAVAFKSLGDSNLYAPSAEAFRLEKVSPVAGLPAYDIYYTWGF
jgi:hypothetical protein